MRLRRKKKKKKTLGQSGQSSALLVHHADPCRVVQKYPPAAPLGPAIVRRCMLYSVLQSAQEVLCMCHVWYSLFRRVCGKSFHPGPSASGSESCRPSRLCAQVVTGPFHKGSKGKPINPAQRAGEDHPCRPCSSSWVGLSEAFFPLRRSRGRHSRFDTYNRDYPPLAPACTACGLAPPFCPRSTAYAHHTPGRARAPLSSSSCCTWACLGIPPQSPSNNALALKSVRHFSLLHCSSSPLHTSHYPHPQLLAHSPLPPMHLPRHPSPQFMDCRARRRSGFPRFFL